MLALVLLALMIGALLIAAVLVRRADRHVREREAEFNRTLGRIRRGGRVTLHRFQVGKRVEHARQERS